MEGLELARKHFATALKLNSDNVRALYGLCWVGHLNVNNHYIIILYYIIIIHVGMPHSQ